MDEEAKTFIIELIESANKEHEAGGGKTAWEVNLTLCLAEEVARLKKEIEQLKK